MHKKEGVPSCSLCDDSRPRVVACFFLLCRSASSHRSLAGSLLSRWGWADDDRDAPSEHARRSKEESPVNDVKRLTELLQFEVASGMDGDECLPFS